MRMRKLGVLAVGLTAAATMLLGAGVASASSAVPDSSDNCTTGVCRYIDRTGLYVSYAAVTNENEVANYGYIENVDDGSVHRSSTMLHPGQAWAYDFNRDLANGDQICGWIGSDPGQMACGTIDN
jgi:hypothetical protein